MEKFDVTQLPEFDRWLREGMLGAAKRGIRSAAERALQAIVTEIIPGEQPPPVDEGHYRQAWRVEPEEMGASLVNDMPYASVIEWGARAENIKIGRKMIAALTKWVARKGFAGEEDPEHVAWAIAKAMQKRGIFNRDAKGLRIGEKAKAKFLEYLPAEIVREMRRMEK